MLLRSEYFLYISNLTRIILHITRNPFPAPPTPPLLSSANNDESVAARSIEKVTKRDDPVGIEEKKKKRKCSSHSIWKSDIYESVCVCMWLMNYIEIVIFHSMCGCGGAPQKLLPPSKNACVCVHKVTRFSFPLFPSTLWITSCMQCGCVSEWCALFVLAAIWRR